MLNIIIFIYTRFKIFVIGYYILYSFITSNFMLTLYQISWLGYKTQVNAVLTFPFIVCFAFYILFVIKFLSLLTLFFLGCLKTAFNLAPPPCKWLYLNLSLQQSTLIFILCILAPSYTPLYFSKHWFAPPPLKIFPKKTYNTHIYLYILCI